MDSIRSFGEVSFSDFEKGRETQFINEITLQGKEYILRIDEDVFVQYLYDKYVLEHLNINRESETIDVPRKSIEKATDSSGGNTYEMEWYIFTITYTFTGSPILFRVQPNQRVMTFSSIILNESFNQVSFQLKLHKQDPKEFFLKKDQCFKKAFVNIENINRNAEQFNRALRQKIEKAFQKEKNKYLRENNFFAAINIKVNPETQSVFSAPTITRKIIPQPAIPKNKEFASEPMMSMEMYEDVLKVIYDSGKSMEKKTALYVGKNEEGLRDQFLFVLETRYVGATASGETFNRSGKTDIILKYTSDGSNLFVAECKFWHGASEFLAAISQLFERYLTWRDSKVALLMFVKTRDFTKVLSTIKSEIKNHDLFMKGAGGRGETSFSYVFCLPQDKSKHVFFEVIAFHYDKT